MRAIKLGGIHGAGLVTLVDDEDYDRVSQFNWYAQPDGNTIYAQRRPNAEAPYRSVHRMILEVTDRDVLVDHRNNNGLDNTRGNLRVATYRQNSLNKPTKPSSGFRGVCWHKRNGVFIASIREPKTGKIVHLGYFKAAEDAARAYDSAARVFNGEFARLNFPDHKAA